MSWRDIRLDPASPDPDDVRAWFSGQYEAVMGRLPRWTRKGGFETSVSAPYRRDDEPSLSFDAREGEWFDHGVGRGGGIKALCDLAGWESPFGRPSAEMPEARRAREERERALAAEAQMRAARLGIAIRQRWDRARPVESVDAHPYMRRKGIDPAPYLRVDDGDMEHEAEALREHGGPVLLAPIQDAEGAVVGLHRIFCNGHKRDVGPKGGHFLPVAGDWRTAGTCFVVEGLADGASLAQLAPAGVAILTAFGASNVPAVCEEVRMVNRRAELFAAADADEAGRKAAREAAKHGALPLIPEGRPGLDWCDLLCEEGEAMAREILVQAIDEARRAPAPILLGEDDELDLPGDGVPFPDDEQDALDREFDNPGNGRGDKSDGDPDNGPDNGPDRDLRDESGRESHKVRGPEKGKKDELHGGPALRLNAISARDLARMELPEIRWAVPDFVPEGLTILGGPPKLGKSVLALHLALAVASGGVAFSAVPAERGAVLYLALEDTNRRLQGRIRAACPDGNVPADLGIVREAPRVGEGLEEALQEWIAAHPSVRLVIVDTWQKIRPPRKSGSDPYEADYRTVGALKKIADDAGIAVILIHHTRKGPSNPVGAEGDFLESLLGSQAIAGAADGVMVLRRARGERSMTLSLTGRDIEERSVALTADFEGMTYRLEGDAVEARATEIQRRIIRVLRDRGEDVSVGDVAAETGAKRDSVRTACWKMERSGLIRRGAKNGYYRYGDPPLSPSPASCFFEERKERKERRNGRNGGTEALSPVIPVPTPPLRSSAFPGVPEGGTATKPCAARVHENSVPPFLPFLESDGTRGTGAESPEGVPPERSEERERNGRGCCATDG